MLKDFFDKGGLEANRIITKGYGEVHPTDDKSGRDNIKYRDELDYIHNRRVDISFEYYGHDAKTIVYETILGSTPTNIKIEPVNHDTKACFINPKHKKEIAIINSNIGALEGDTIPATSRLSGENIVPLNYIWPIYCLTNSRDSYSSVNEYLVHLHSCRYYSVNNNPTLSIKVYPDIEWELEFFLNLTNALSVKWQNLNPEEHKEYQKKAGKIGAERRWEQKNTSFGFSLLAKWDKVGSTYKREKELKAEYESKFKKLYDIFSSLNSLADGVTSKTKGVIKKKIPGVPAAIEFNPPNFSLSGEWFLEKVDSSIRNKEVDTNKTNSSDYSMTGDWFVENTKPKTWIRNDVIGTNVAINLKADPLVGLTITIDLLGAAIVGAAGLLSGGAAAPGVRALYNRIQRFLKQGLELGNEEYGAKGSIDIYMDLILSCSIKLDYKVAFNTAGNTKGKQQSSASSSSTATIKVELKLGIKIRGEVALGIISVQGYFEASASGDAAITFGSKLTYDEKGLYFRPILGFDGLNAEYVVYISLSLAKKIKKDKSNMEVNSEDKVKIFGDKYPDVIPPFDVIEKLESLFDISANIPLIKN